MFFNLRIQDNSDEFDNDANHLSGKQLLADTEIRIDYGDGTTFDTPDDQAHESRGQSQERDNNLESDEVGDYSEGDNVTAGNNSPSDKLPLNVEFTWAKGDLEQQDYQNISDLRKQDELAPPLAFF